MGLKRNLLILFVFVFLFPMPVNAVSWELYFTDEHGVKYFIDKDSVQKTPGGTFLVWHQLIFPETYKLKWELHKSKWE